MDQIRTWHPLFETGNIVPLPRLTAGLYATIRVLSARTVIIPNNCCINVVYGVLLAGAVPVFCEVDLETGSLNTDACEELLRRTRADMVVHVHSFGVFREREAIYELCRKFGAFFFEDGASWFPPDGPYEVLRGSCLGLSFGQKKIFELGGGLLCFDDRQLGKDVEACLLSVADAQATTGAYEIEYDSMIGADRLPKDARCNFADLAEKYRACWIGTSARPMIPYHKEQIDQERRRRKTLAAEFSNALTDRSVRFLRDDPLNFPWRFSFLCTNPWFVRAMTAGSGLFVSRLFPPLDKFFPAAEQSPDLTKSHMFGSDVFNIALTPDVTVQRIRQTALVYRERPWLEILLTELGRVVDPGCVELPRFMNAKRRLVAGLRARVGPGRDAR